jgi:WD40 repeat protein
VIAWDLRGGHRSPLYAHAGRVLALAVGPGPRLFTAGTDGAVIAWSRSAGAVRLQLGGGRPRALAVSPVGDRLAIADAGGDVRWWDLPRASAPPTRFRSPSPINGLCFLDDGSLFGASDDGALLAWRDGALVDVWTTDVSGATAVACRRAVDRSVAEITTATRDGKIVAWPVAPAQTLASVRAFLDDSTRFELSNPESSP